MVPDVNLRGAKGKKKEGRGRAAAADDEPETEEGPMADAEGGAALAEDGGGRTATGGRVSQVEHQTHAPLSAGCCGSGTCE